MFHIYDLKIFFFFFSMGNVTCFVDNEKEIVKEKYYSRKELKTVKSFFMNLYIYVPW